MARSLNLKVEHVADGIKVSWTDIAAKPHQGVAVYVIFGLCILGGFIASFAVGFGLLAIVVLAAIGIPMLWMLPEERSNSVTFGRDETKLHDDKTFPTSRISRIEYGDELSLTGAIQQTAMNSEHATPQNLIRLWIDDSAAYPISLNRWQTQVNHEIRDALDRALQEVRQGQAEAAHVAKYGQQDEKGMPDY